MGGKSRKRRENKIILQKQKGKGGIIKQGKPGELFSAVRRSAGRRSVWRSKMLNDTLESWKTGLLQDYEDSLLTLQTREKGVTLHPPTPTPTPNLSKNTNLPQTKLKTAACLPRFQV